MKRFINRITEKIAFQMVDSGSSEDIVIDVKNIEKYIGHPLYRSNKFYGLLPPPVSELVIPNIYRVWLSALPIMTMVELSSTSNQHKVLT